MGNERQIRELLDLARDSSMQARMRLVSEIGDLFAERETVLSEHERAMMTDILEKLIGDFEMSVRHILAERLAQEPKAPRALVNILANDAIEVARPVLMHSDVLRDQELIEIVRQRTRQHRLAVALRREISESVSDALVENDEDDVIRTLLCNRSARISEATMAYLVDQARQVDSFQEPLVARGDLGADLARRLVGYVSAALRVRILEQYDISETELDDLLEPITQEFVQSHDVPEQASGGDGDAASETEPAGGNRSAWTLARRIAAERDIDSTLIVKVLRRGEIPLFEALFGEFSGIGPPRLQHILYEPGGRSLAVVCRALGVEKTNFAPIFLLSRKATADGPVVDPRELSRILSFFEEVDPEAASHVVRRWQRTPNYLEAVETMEEDTGFGSKRGEG